MNIFFKKNATIMMLLLVVFLGSFWGKASAKGRASGNTFYLHTDRETYLPGDTIWAKGFFIVHKEKPVNDAVAVYWEDCSGTAISRMQNFKRGSDNTVAIMLVVPHEIPGGAYNLVVTDGEKDLTKRSVNIISGNGTNTQCVEKSDILFYPEGGSFVAGELTKIALRFTGAYTRQQNLSGEVRDQDEKYICSFSNLYNGLGFIMLTAEQNKRYYAVIKNDPQSKRHLLPIATTDKVLLKTSRDAQYVTYSFNTIPGPSQPAFFVAQHNGDTLSLKTIQNKAGAIRDSIATGSLASGVLRLAMFDAQKQLIAERLHFINNKEYLLPGAFKTSLLNTGAFAENLLAINFENPVKGTFSVSVTDGRLEMPPAFNQNIYTTVLLSNYLKDPVHFGMEFFEGPDSTMDAIIDLALIANEWMRVPQTTPIVQPAQLSGQIFHKGTKKPFENQPVQLVTLSEDSVSQSYTFTTTTSGNFIVPGHNLYDRNKLIFSAANTRYSIDVTLNEIKTLPKTEKDRRKVEKNKDTEIPATPYDSLLNNPTYLERVTVKATIQAKEKALMERYATGNFKTLLGDIYDLRYYANDTRSVVDFMTPNYQRIKVLVDDKGDRKMEFGKGKNCRLYLNEVPIDIDQLDKIQINDVAIIKIIDRIDRDPKTFQELASVLIYTRKGVDYIASDAPYDITYFDGYTTIATFKHSNPTSSDETGRRATIYWNPRAATSSRVPVIPIHFYNNGKTQQFKVVVEGITENNQLVHFEKLLQ